MVYKYDLEFIPNNGIGHMASDFGLIMEEYPDIPAAKKVFNTYSIPGRAGQLVQDTKTKDNITIEATLTLLTPPQNQLEYRDYIRQIQRWLNGSGWLSFSDEQNTRYKVLAIQFGDSDRITPIYGKINVAFIVEPYEYLASGFLTHDISELKYNGYDLCKPLYIIKGNTTGTITVNGVQFTINSVEQITIDSALMLTYTTIGGEVKNQAITGDYEDLWLPTGDVEILATIGLTVEVQPRWGWEL